MSLAVRVAVGLLVAVIFSVTARSGLGVGVVVAVVVVVTVQERYQ